MNYGMYNIMNCCKKKDNLLLYETGDHKIQSNKPMQFYYLIMIPSVFIIFTIIFILYHINPSHDNSKNITLP